MKRGLSGVVAIFLIIMVSLIAAGVFWGFIFGTITIVSDEVENQSGIYVKGGNPPELGDKEVDDPEIPEDGEDPENPLQTEFLFPSARSYGYYLMPYTRFGVYGDERFPDYSAEDVFNFWLDKHDLIVSNYETEDYKIAEPERIVFGGIGATEACCYNYTTDELFWNDQLTYLYNWIDENHEDYFWNYQFENTDKAFEDCFIHVTEDMNLSFVKSFNLQITAYSAENPTRSRLPSAWSDYAWLMNIKSPVYISFWEDYFAVKNANNSAEGYFLDVLEWSRGANFNTDEEFEKIREFNSREEYENNLSELVDKIRNSVHKAYPEKLIGANTFNSLEDEEPPKFSFEDNVDFYIREGSIIYSVALPKFEDELLVSSRLGKQGKIVARQQMLYFYSDLDRDRIAGLASYYLSMNDNVYFFSHKDPANDPYSCWFEAIAYDIGKPVGEYYIFAQGPDPSNIANTYFVLARNFTKGMVLVKPRPSWSFTDYGSSSATIHNLPGIFRSLNVDGVPGPEINEVSLRNWEGAILLKVKNSEPFQDQGSLIQL